MFFGMGVAVLWWGEGIFSALKLAKGKDFPNDRENHGIS
jgi:hypothetical protein